MRVYACVCVCVGGGGYVCKCMCACGCGCGWVHACGFRWVVIRTPQPGSTHGFCAGMHTRSHAGMCVCVQEETFAALTLSPQTQAVPDHRSIPQLTTPVSPTAPQFPLNRGNHAPPPEARKPGHCPLPACALCVTTTPGTALVSCSSSCRRCRPSAALQQLMCAPAPDMARASAAGL